MKTDNELNHLIAERVMGWKELPLDDDLGDVWEMPNSHINMLPWYCTDPAAWGALFVWLAGQPRHQQIRLGHGVKDWYAVICGTRRADVSASDPLPGRALALATLAAHGVEVE
jgi:hypothetical protein